MGFYFIDSHFSPKQVSWGPDVCTIKPIWHIIHVLSFYKHDLVFKILFILSTPELHSLLSTLGSLLLVYNYNFVLKIGLS